MRKKTLVILYILGWALALLALASALISIAVIFSQCPTSTCPSPPGPVILGLVLAGILIVAGMVLLVIAWIRILMNQAQRQQWTWFVWTFLFSWVAMAIYLIKVPETPQIAAQAQVPLPPPPRTWGSTISAVGPRLLVGVGIFGLALGGILAWNTLGFLPGTVSTTGTIIACSITQDSSSIPTVSFQTQAGQHLTFRGSEPLTGCLEGETVPVVYHPTTPQDARIESISWLGWVVIGSLPLLLGLYFYVRRWIRKARA